MNVIQRYREKTGDSCARIAALSGLDRSTVWRHLHGGGISLRSMRMYAKGLKLTAKTILQEEEHRDGENGQRTELQS